jgi:hypothetical protein
MASAVKAWISRVENFTGGKVREPHFEITLTLKVTVLAGAGSLHVRRQQVADTLGDVIERMLTKKLPKLVNTPATRRVLLLERRHMNLVPKQILDEIESRRPSFPALKKRGRDLDRRDDLLRNRFRRRVYSVRAVRGGHTDRQL